MASYLLRIRNLITVGLIVVSIWALRATTLAQEKEVIAGGEVEFQQHCAACHGVGGKGDGPRGKHLAVKPADLTQLRKKNEGRFPFWRVYRTIDGREEVKGHGTREMQIWGARFQKEAQGSGREARTLVAGRILGLVFYLRYIQER